ncbi:MAG: efflux RND transporter periplasmic adaptor subunit [Planctomycetota bacterium]
MTLPWIALLGCTQDRPVVIKSSPVSAIAVKTVAVQSAPIQRSTTQPASVHAFFRSTIRARITGYVKELQADIGDLVQAGDLLAVVDVPEQFMQREVLQSQVRRLGAQERRFQSGVDLAQAGVVASSAMVAQAVSQFAGIDAAFAAAEAEFTRTEDLVQRGSLQVKMLDEARFKRDAEAARREAAEAAVASAEADLLVARAKLDAAKSELQAAEASTDVARKQLNALEIELQFARIVAPIDGIVTQRTVEPGDLVHADSAVADESSLFVVSQTDRVRVRLAVPETDAPLVRTGDKMTLVLPSLDGDRVIAGAVTRRSGELDPGTRTMTVEAVIDNPDGLLLPGMFGQATIDFQGQASATVLPSRSVRFSEDGNAFAYALDEQDRVEVIPLEVGFDNGNLIEVKGVSAGRRVIAANLNRFVDGQKVSVLP